MLLGVLLGLYLIAECVSLCSVGRDLTRGVVRLARRKLHGSREIPLTQDLRIAAANGLLKVGSEIVVGTEHQWNGVTVSRFAVAPSIAQAEAGVILQVIRLEAESIEVKPLPDAKETCLLDDDSADQSAP